MIGKIHEVPYLFFVKGRDYKEINSIKQIRGIIIIFQTINMLVKISLERV